MAIPIFISPSQQSENSCKFGDTEQDHCRLIGSELNAFFKKDNRFISSMASIITGSVETKCNGAVSQSNAFITSYGGAISGNPSYHIAIHTDAGGGDGCSGFYSGTGKGKKATRSCLDQLNKISPWEEQSFIERTGLIEMKSIASTVYLECNFHDNLNQANWIHSNIKNIAKAIYKGILNVEGLQEVVEVVTNNEQWKKDLVQAVIDLGLLEDKSWINKANDNMPVYAVCKMMMQLYKKCAIQNLDENVKKIIDSTLISNEIVIKTVIKK